LYLFYWVKALYDFDQIYAMTEPLRIKLAACEKVVAEKTALLKEKQGVCDEINRKLAILQQGYDSSIQQKTDLTNRKKECEKQLKNAEILIVSLADESVRWANDVK